MAANHARWPPLKNTAWRVYFPLLDADGDPVANGAGDTPDSERSIDGANFADCSNEMVEVEVDSGIYYLDLNASEMNGDCICIIAKTATAGTKTTPIVVYPVSGGFNELVLDHDKTQSDILLIDGAIDSDALLADADHDKTQSDVALLSTKMASDVLILEADIATIDAAIDSDSVLYLADHDKTQSDILLLSGKADSDALLADADHDKSQSDILLLSDKVASDNLLTQSDLSDIISELVVLDAAIDSDMILVIAEHDATQAKIESDSILADADHDKTQSDILLLDAAVDSDSVLYLADHDKTQSDIALLDAGIVRFTVDTVVNGHAPTTTEFQADDITEATADHYIGRIVTWLTGVLAGQSTDITDYAAVGGIGQFTVTAMTDAPANNDTGKIT